MKTLLAFIFAASATIAQLQAALTITYGNQTGGDTSLRDLNGVALSAGSKGTIGDGTVIQIGYYTMATSANPFAGEWVALVGTGTSVSATTMGDVSGTDGIFAGTAVLDPGSASYPAISTPLAIRFYDGTTLANSTHYNAVNLPEWSWLSPTTTNSIGMAIWDPVLVTMIWEGGSGSAFRTTISYAVPEPSAASLAMIAGGFLFLRRRRA